MKSDGEGEDDEEGVGGFSLGDCAAVVLTTGPERFLALEVTERVRAITTKKHGEVATFVLTADRARRLRCSTNCERSG